MLRDARSNRARRLTSSQKCALLAEGKESDALHS